MRFTLTLIIVVNCIIVNAQKSKTNDIIALSKELLTESVGTDLIKYFDFSEPNGSFYNLKKNRFGHVPRKSFEPHKRLRKNWTEIWVHWYFNYPRIKGVHSGLWVKLNSRLELIEPIELDFIPSFVWDNKPSNFISIERATEIGNSKLTQTEFERTEPKLSYDNKKKKYIYTIQNKLTSEKDNNGKERGILEILEIDAVTGKPYELIKGYHGIYIR